MTSKLSLIIFLAALSGCPVAAAMDRDFEVVAPLTQGPGNLTVTGSGQIVISQHQFYEPQFSVVQLSQDNVAAAFPNHEMNDRRHASGVSLDSVLGIRSDVAGVVWMLDNGMRSRVTPKLVAWDTALDRLSRVIYLPPPVAPQDSFVNDFTIDTRHKNKFIAEFPEPVSLKQIVQT